MLGFSKGFLWFLCEPKRRLLEISIKTAEKSNNWKQKIFVKVTLNNAEISRKVPPLLLQDYTLGSDNVHKSIFVLESIVLAIVLGLAVKCIFFLFFYCFHTVSVQLVLFSVWSKSVCLMSAKRTPCFPVKCTLYCICSAHCSTATSLAGICHSYAPKHLIKAISWY